MFASFHPIQKYVPKYSCKYIEKCPEGYMLAATSSFHFECQKIHDC
jgi:hypothetical protein